MSADQYINKIVRKLKCSGARKKEIRKELWTDFNCRLEQGEKAEDIISQMGTVKEIADSFNENISEKEKRIYLLKKIASITVPIMAVFVLAAFMFFWILPKGVDIKDSKYFEQAQVEQVMKETIELLDAEDYGALKENAIPQMADVLQKGAMDQAKKQVSTDWGTRKDFGSVYIMEMVQKDQHFAVGEITVTYENVSVVYRITYDQDMKLAGIYMR